MVATKRVRSSKLAKACAAMQAARLVWHAEMTADEVRGVVGVIGGYNEFDPAKARALVDGIEAAMAAIPGNPVRHAFMFGREYSPCLYVSVTKRVVGEEVDFAALAERLKGLGEDAKADEAWVDRETRLRWEFRWFWD